MKYLEALFPHLPFPDGCTLKGPAKGSHNIRLVIQYKGTAYAGWQRQKGGITTIQEVLEDCISKMINEKIKVNASGRTDAGVHALVQVVNFHTNSTLSPDVFLKGLNSLLPKDIIVRYTDEVSSDFHSRFNAKSKAYMYLILNDKISSPFFRDFSWQIYKKLNLDGMKQAANYLLGTHDFASFMNVGTSVESTVREIYNLEIKNIPPFIIIEIEANGFLRHMARNIVGLLVEIGKGERFPNEVPSIIEGTNRALAAITAPAHGLFLKAIKY